MPSKFSANHKNTENVDTHVNDAHIHTDAHAIVQGATCYINSLLQVACS